MMLEVALISLIIVFLRGVILQGGLTNKHDFVLIKGWYFFVLGLLTQRLPDITAFFQLHILSNTLKDNFKYLHMLSYLFVVTSLVLNIKMHSVKIVLVGTLMNIMPIFTNSGYMPVSKDAIYLITQQQTDFLVSNQLDYKHVLIDSKTKLSLLSDIIPTPSWYPLKQVFSSGDVFIAIGIFFLIQQIFFIKKQS